jgi:hypothetical protein
MPKQLLVYSFGQWVAGRQEPTVKGEASEGHIITKTEVI